MSPEGRASVAARVVLTLLGVAVGSTAALVTVALMSDAVDGRSRAAWVALAAFCLTAVSGWLTLWAASGRNPLGRARPASRRPRRLTVARICLLLAAGLLFVFLLSLPYPPRLSNAATEVAFLGMLIAALYAAATIGHPDPRGRHVAFALGAVMAVQLVRSAFRLSRVVGTPEAGPAPVISFLLAWTCFGCAILAALCVLSLRGGGWPPRNPDPADGVVS